MAGPVHKVKSSLCWGLTVNIWENDKGYTFSVDKSYKKDGEYKKSEYLFANEVVALSTVLIPRALKWMDENYKPRNKDGDTATVTPADTKAFDDDALPDGF